MDNYHITKKNDEWVLNKEGNKKPIQSSNTKENAIQTMRDFMKDKEGSVKIHKEDGKIQEERTYPKKSDPHKSKG